MLSLLRVFSPEQKLETLRSVAADEVSWVVSDLRSKMFLRDHLHGEHVLLPDSRVLRASDLWSELVEKTRPELQAVPPETIQLLILNSLRTNKKLAEIRVNQESLAELVFQYLDQLVGVFGQPNGYQTLQEFLAENPESQARWGKWFEVAAEVWRDLEQQDIYVPKWAAPYLLSSPGWEDAVAPKRYYFDLGNQLSDLELELIESVAAIHDVTIVESVYGDLPRSRVYEVAEALAKKVEAGIPVESSTHEEFLRVTTPLAEIKDVVCKIRQSLDAGVPAGEHAIVAPNIESYWPILESYLLKEGIPAKKSTLVRLNSLPSIQSWLGRLRTQLQNPRFHDLEQGYFNHMDANSRVYKRFKYLFENVNSRGELEGVIPLRKQPGQKVDPKNDSDQQNSNTNGTLQPRLSREAFLLWSLKEWPSQAPLEDLEEALMAYYGQTPSRWDLSAQDHLQLLERLIGRKEKSIQNSSLEGVEVLSLMALEYVPSKKVFLMGLTSDALRTSQKTQITLSDVIAIAAKTGLVLPHPEATTLESELQWLRQSDGKKATYYFCESDLDGTPQAPALFWLMGAEPNSEVAIPGPTRWDQIHRRDLEEIGELAGWDEARTSSVRQSVRVDLGEDELPSFPMEKTRFSASSIESFYKCPFIFAAQKVFRLEDERSVDMDLDASKRGRLMHKVFEILMSTPEPSTDPLPNEERIDAAIDQAFADLSEERGKILQDKRVWDLVRGRYRELARRFLDMERKWHEENPGWKTLANEKRIELFFDADSGDFTESPTETQFLAYIDRVDQHESGSLQVLDYKSSSGGQTNYSSWIKNRSVQLPIYTMMAESEYKAEVTAANYYVVKEAKRNVGFVSESNPTDSGQSRYNKITLNAKEELLTNCKEIIGEAVVKVTSGSFQPQPDNPKDCISCRWRKLCRAPHLT